MKNKIRISERNEKIMNDLCKHFEDVLDIKVLTKSRYGIYTTYRSLFNTILHKRHQIKYPEISEFYKTKNLKFDRGTIRNSVCKFSVYSNDFPELYEIFKDLTKVKGSGEIENKIKLTPLQELVSNLTTEQEQDLKELITLRKKSWEWKSNDKITIYEGSY